MLILVRHGQSESNAAGLLVGRADVALTTLGRDQALRAGRLLATERLQAAGATSGAAGADERATAPRRRPARLLTSPLARARATAEAIAAELAAAGEVIDPVVEDRLIELDYGELEGRRPADVEREIWARWQSDTAWRPTGGESFEQLHGRLDPLWEALVPDASAGDVIAVSHVSPIKAAVAWAIGAGPELAWRLSLGVCSITRIRTAGAVPSLVSFGETGHLITTG